MSLALRRRSIDARPDRPKARPLIIVLLLVAVTLTALDRATDSGPVDAITDYVRDGFASITDLTPFGNSPSGLEKENERLRNELADAQGQLATGADAERERTRLTELFNLQTPDGVPKVVARVTSLGGSNFESSIEIGKGSNDGIAAGMPVVTGAGLVGRVIETSGNRSTVLLATDTTSNVGVRFSATGDIGASTGQGINKNMRVDLIDLDSKVQAGEVAVTSGLQNSLYPPGIPVGRVVSSNAGPQDLRRNVDIEPIVRTNALDDVAVLQWRPQAR